MTWHARVRAVCPHTATGLAPATADTSDDEDLDLDALEAAAVAVSAVSGAEGSAVEGFGGAGGVGPEAQAGCGRGARLRRRNAVVLPQPRQTAPGENVGTSVHGFTWITHARSCARGHACARTRMGAHAHRTMEEGWIASRCATVNILWLYSAK